MSSEFCRAKAAAVLAELGCTGPPVDVVAVANAHGLTVQFVARATGFAGRLVRERMIIEVNQRHHRHKQRFTIAHEIGHFILDHSPVVSAFDDRSITDPSRVNERQANVFGSALLMPERWVREHWRQAGRIDEMANTFEVSSEAMYYRLSDLDLLDLPSLR